MMVLIIYSLSLLLIVNNVLKNVIWAKNSYVVVPGKNSGAHAEYNLMIKLLRKLSKLRLHRKNFNLVVLKFTNTLQLSLNSMPCKNCLNSLRKLKINKVFYLSDGILTQKKYIELLFSDHYHITRSFR